MLTFMKADSRERSERMWYRASRYWKSAVKAGAL
jgi:hypothetical protein